MLGWIYFIFIGVLLLATFVIGAISLGNPNLTKGKYSKSLIPGLIILSVAFIAFSLLMPVVMPQILKIVGEEIKEYNELGDAVGGLMNPFIAIAAVIVTGLAFYVQYQANQQLRGQFKVQQIESQFYEMLRLHKENVNEIEVKDMENKRAIAKGRNAFPLFKTEFEMALRMFMINEEELNNYSFYLLYHMFFVGEKHHKEVDVAKAFPFFYNRLKKSYPVYKVDSQDINWNLEDEYYKFYHDFSINPFLGHSNYLGHYYRHLYQTVKYIVNQYGNKILTYESAMNYLKILRAQLSNDEQVMLFYNWVAGLYKQSYGFKWENNENNYFTEFLMIHNLPYDYLFNHQFIKRKVQQLRDIPTSLRNENLFEWD